MDTSPQHTALTQQLPRDVFYQLIHTLRAALPTVSDAPEDIARRDNSAIAQVASLLPANADEASIAAQYVAAGARAMECMRAAQEAVATDPAFALKYTAQAAAMLRQARAMRALLLRMQAERRACEADSAALEQAVAAQHCAIGLMTQAIAPPPPATDIAAEADRYALKHRKRAALIRSLGRLPDKLDCGPLSDELVSAIVNGDSPVLRSLDKVGSPSRLLAA